MKFAFGRIFDALVTAAVNAFKSAAEFVNCVEAESIAIFRPNMFVRISSRVCPSTAIFGSNVARSNMASGLLDRALI